LQDLSLHILDVAENGLRAGASRLWIRVREDLSEDLMEVEVEDNGEGMTPELSRKALDPFVTTRTTRRVGLGLPLLADAAREAEGDVEVSSQPGQGTRVRATFRHGHIDRKPLGDMGSTVASLLLADPRMGLVYEHSRDGQAFRLDANELRVELDPVPLDKPEVINWIRAYVRQGLEEIGAGEG
jgi:hypothetical protein